MDKQKELLDKIHKIKHNVGRLVPVTIELMFDACLGIIYEEYAATVAKVDARQKMHGEDIRLGILRAKAANDLKHAQALLVHLKERVTEMYAEVKNEHEQKKDKKNRDSKQDGGGDESSKTS